TCETMIGIRGYLFLDKNENDLMDNNEEGIAGVSITTYYTDEEGNKVTIDTFETDENGYWESEICPGEYTMEIDQDDLPKNVESPDIIDLQVADNLVEPMELNIAATDTRNFWQKYWYLILIAGAVIVTIGYVAVTGRKKEIIQ
ncbi:MAG: SdrD B-like domain-containing protein, partial [Candidatus Dojkabacteria bacterium]|nr:SdrD B-like domain-containing protein [Candidatus Dojkabacteria bacterium]